MAKGRNLFKMTQFKFIHLIFIIALILVAGVSLLWFFHVYVPYPFPNKESYLLLLIYFIVLSVTAFVYKNSHFVFLHKKIGFHRTSLKYILYSVIIAISTWTLDYLLQTALLNRNITHEAVTWGMKNKNLAIAFSSTVIFAPIIEEMLLRGIFLQTINQYLSKFWSALSISLLFTVVHMSWLDAPSLFFAALLYAWLTFESKSIVPAIIAHVLNNCFTFVYYLLLIKEI